MSASGAVPVTIVPSSSSIAAAPWWLSSWNRSQINDRHASTTAPRSALSTTAILGGRDSRQSVGPARRSQRSWPRRCPRLRLSRCRRTGHHDAVAASVYGGREPKPAASLDPIAGLPVARECSHLKHPVLTAPCSPERKWWELGSGESQEPDAKRSRQAFIRPRGSGSAALVRVSGGAFLRAKLLLVDDEAQRGRHPGALV